MHIRRLAACAAALLLCACAAPVPQESAKASGIKMGRGKPVLIATPKNGVYEGKEYPLSGQQTAALLRAAFARLAPNAAVSSRCADFACLQAEGAGNYAYFVIPEILHWEDRNTEWSGIPDRVDIKLVVVDVQKNAEIASVLVTRKSSKLVKTGNGLPEDLLPEPFQQFVQSLY